MMWYNRWAAGSGQQAGREWAFVSRAGGGGQLTQHSPQGQAQHKSARPRGSSGSNARVQSESQAVGAGEE